MADQALHLRSDADLEAALRAFGEDVAWPEAPSDLAAHRPRTDRVLATDRRAGTVALELVAGTAGPGGRGPDPARAGGPRRRRRPGSPGSSADPRPRPGQPATEPRAECVAGSGALPGPRWAWASWCRSRISMPGRASTSSGRRTPPSDHPTPPTSIETLGGQVALVWRSRDGLPDTLEPGVGLIVTAFQGTTDSGFYTKSIGSGTTVKSVPVGVGLGYWLTGDPHFLFYEGPNGDRPRPAAVGRRRPALDARRDHLPAGDLARRGGGDPARRIDALERVERGNRATGSGVWGVRGADPPTPPLRPACRRTTASPFLARDPASSPSFAVALQRPGARSTSQAPSRLARPDRPHPRPRRPPQPVDASPTMPGSSPAARGDSDLQVILASTGERILDLPTGIPNATWGQLVTASTDGTEDGREGPRRPARVRWRRPDDRRRVAAADPRRGSRARRGFRRRPDDRPRRGRACGARRQRPRFAILARTLRGQAPDRRARRGVRIRHALARRQDPLRHRAPGGTARRPLPGARGRHRDRDPARRRSSPTRPATTRRWPAGRSPRPAARTAWSSPSTSGPEHPFIHALSSIDAWALCIDLPATGSDDPDAAADWGLTATADGRSLVAANATLGLAVEIPLSDLAVRRIVTFAPSASSGISLAKFGHAAVGPVGRRLVAAPDGSALYAAGSGGIVRLDAADLAVTGRFLEGTAVEAMAVTPDGALDLRAGRRRWTDRQARRRHRRGRRPGPGRRLRPTGGSRTLVTD